MMWQIAGGILLGAVILAVVTLAINVAMGFLFGTRDE